MQQLRDIKFDDLLFIDLGTARLQGELKEGTPDFKAWEYKMSFSVGEEKDIYEEYAEKADYFPEFAKVVCISVGQVIDGKIVVKSYKGEEKNVLQDFMRDLDLLLKKRPSLRLAGHSLKSFDIPFLFKRSIINRVKINRLIDVGGVKPWEVLHIDTKEIWKCCGNYNTSLVALCLALEVETSVDTVNGMKSSEAYHIGGIDFVADNCQKDVISTIHVVQRMKYEELTTEIVIEEVTEPEPEGVIQRIASTGVITKEDKAELIEKLRGCSYEEKEITIKLVKSALALTKGELDEEFELEMLM